MYSKSQLCVKIGNYLTPNFISPVGVRQGDALSLTCLKYL